MGLKETDKTKPADDSKEAQELQRKREEEARRIQQEIREKKAREEEQRQRENRTEQQTSGVEPITVRNEDGTFVAKDEHGRVTQSLDAHNVTRTFEYDTLKKTELKAFTENNVKWTTEDGLHWHADGQKDRLMRVVVNPEDGAFGIVESTAGKTASTKVQFLNGSCLTKTGSVTELRDKNDALIKRTESSGAVIDVNPVDHSVSLRDSNVRMNNQGQVEEVTYNDGTKAQFVYDQDTKQLVSFTSKNGCFDATQMKGAHVDSDGTLSYEQPDGTLVTIGSDNKEVKHDLNAIDTAANDIQKAISAGDSKKIEEILSAMPVTDHKVLEQRFQQSTNTDLRNEISTKFASDDVNATKLTTLLDRRVDRSDEVGQVQLDIALIKKGNSDAQSSLQSIAYTFVDSLIDRAMGGTGVGVVAGPFSVYMAGEDWKRAGKAQQDLLQTIGLLQPAELENFKADFKNQTGQTIEDYIATSPLSQDAKDALGVYLSKGRDNRTTDDDVELAKSAIEHKDLALFQTIVLLSHDQKELAQKLTALGYRDRLAESFKGDDYTQAKDYFDEGRLSVLTQIKSLDHTLHTDRTEIERIVKNTSNVDKNNYERGAYLASHQSELDPNNAEDKRALEFYNQTHETLQKLSSSQAETLKWESELTKKAPIFAELADAANNPERMYSVVEKMSEADWKLLREDKDSLQKVQEFLNHSTSTTYYDESGASTVTTRDLANEQVAKKVLDMISAKVKSDDPNFSYEQAQKLGNRPISEIFQTDIKEVDKLTALKNLSDDERNAIRENRNGERDQLQAQINKLGYGRQVGQDFLTEIDKGTKPTAYDQVLLNLLADSSENRTTYDPVPSLKNIHDWEKAFAERPDLREKIARESDINLKNQFYSQFAPLLAKHNIELYSDKGAEYVNQILKTGRLDLAHSLTLTDKKEERLSEFNNATQAEKDLLKQTNPTDPAAIELQKTVFKDEHEKLLVQSTLNNADGKMNLADKLYAYSKCDSFTDVNSLQQELSGMSKEQRQQVASEYFQKYHELLSTNLADKLPEDKRFTFKEMLSGADFNVRQLRMDTSIDLDSHRSYADGMLSKFWNAGKLNVNESANQLTDWISKNPEAIKNLKPEDQKRFMQAVQNYQDAAANYSKDKTKFAEQFTDTAITVAVMGSGLMTGFTSTAAYYSLLASAAVAGGTFKVVATKGIEGTDFDGSEKHIMSLMFRGGSEAMLGLIGPEFGLAKVGPNIAKKSVAEAIETLGPELAGKTISADAQKVLAQELQDMSRQVALGRGEKFEEIAKKALVDGTPEQQKLLADALRQQVSSKVTTDLRENLQKKVLFELESAGRSSLIGTVAGAAPELVATPLGLESPDTLWERMKSAGISGAEGALFFHVVFKGAGSIVSLRKTNEGFIAGKDTVIERDGKFITVKDEMKLQPNDRIVEDVKTQKPVESVSKNSTVKTERTSTDAPYVVLSDGTKVDPVTATMLEKSGLTPDSYVYRKMDPKFLNTKDSTVAGNPNSTPLIADPYDMVPKFPGVKELDYMYTEKLKEASSVGPGLNVHVVDNPDAYKQDGMVYIRIKVSDLLKRNAKIYHDEEAAIRGINPLYITYDGSVRYEIVPPKSEPSPIPKPDTVGNPQPIPKPTTPLESRTDNNSLVNPNNSADTLPKSNSSAETLPKPNSNADTLPKSENNDLYNAPSSDTVTTYNTTPNVDLSGVVIPENAKYLRLGRRDLTLVPGGNMMEIGRAEIGTYSVLPNHASVGLTTEGKPYLWANPEQAKNTFVKVRGTNEWKRLQDLQGEYVNGGVRRVINYGDQVRLGSTGDANLDLSSLTQANFKVGSADVNLVPGQRKMLGRTDIDPNDTSISRNHLAVGLDENGRTYVWEDPSKPSLAGTFVRRQGSDTFVRLVPGVEMHVLPGDEVRLGAPVFDASGNVIPGQTQPGRPIDLKDMYREVSNVETPTVTRWQKFKQELFGSDSNKAASSGIVRTENGGLRYRDERGLVQEYADGSKFIRTDSGAELTEVGGRITSMKTANGAQFRYEYDGQNNLARVWFGNQPFQQTSTRHWTVERDGSLHLTEQVNGKTAEAYYRSDGSTEVADPNVPGRFRTENINNQVEEFKISRLAEIQVPSEQLPQFKNLLQELKQSRLTHEQQGEVLHQINRLLADDANSVLKPAERAVLAQQALQLTLHPELIDQGSRPSCPAASLEKKMAYEEPGEYLRIIADCARTGKYVTSDGKVVDAAGNGALKIDSEAAARLKNGLPDPHKSEYDANRTWTSQIFQGVAVNALYQEKDPFLRFVNREGGNYDALVYALDGSTCIFNNEKVHSPYVTNVTEIETMYSKLTGKKESFALAVNITSVQQNPVILDGQVLGYEQELGRKLLDFQSKGKHAIVGIDATNDPFWTTSGAGSAGGSGGAGTRGADVRGHAVMIKDIEVVYVKNTNGTLATDQNGNPLIDLNRTKISVENTWGRSADLVRKNTLTNTDTRITLKQLYDSMKRWNPNQ